MFGDDADREHFFEAAVKQAQDDFKKDNTNAQALVRWGGALLELAHYKAGKESTDMIHMAVGKLQQSLDIDPSRTDAEWCLGNAFTSMGFLQDDKPSAQKLFSRASSCFKKCSSNEPRNETYKKAIEMCEKAPEYYDEIQAHIQAQLIGSMGGGDGGAKAQPSPADFWYDVGGWVLLGALIVGTMFMARSSVKASQ